MNDDSERQLNHQAYRRMRDTIKQNYPPGRFVAISGGQIVADAAQFDEVRAAVQALGKDPARVLIVQAGADYPETATILPLPAGQR